MTKNLRFRQCECCGNYFTVTNSLDIDKVLYCSPACRTKFDRCCVCGNYFPTDAGYDTNEDEENRVPLCSEECAAIYYDNSH